MQTLSPLEAAEKLESTSKWLDDKEDFNCGQDAMRYAASILRAIAAGEYKQVVHAHWAVVNTRKISKKVACSWCGKAGWNFQNLPRCPFCGALMDGKDDTE